MQTKDELDKEVRKAELNFRYLQSQRDIMRRYDEVKLLEETALKYKTEMEELNNDS